MSSHSRAGRGCAAASSACSRARRAWWCPPASPPTSSPSSSPSRETRSHASGWNTWTLQTHFSCYCGARAARPLRTASVKLSRSLACPRTLCYVCLTIGSFRGAQVKCVLAHASRMIPVTKQLEPNRMFYCLHGKKIPKKTKFEFLQKSHLQIWIQVLWHTYPMDYLLYVSRRGFHHSLRVRHGTDYVSKSC